MAYAGAPTTGLETGTIPSGNNNNTPSHPTNTQAPLPIVQVDPPADIQAPAPTYSEQPYNEKTPYANNNAQGPPQPGFQMTPIQQGFQNQNQPPSRPQNNYPHAVPLCNLQKRSEPVDCPVCGYRELTHVEFSSGAITQYVFSGEGISRDANVVQ